jgi:23S rRNA (guanosine2251-2'-O)-methyltransferase
MNKDKKFVLILDNIRSLFNAGSIFRLADGAGVDKIYLGGITCLTGRQAGQFELNRKVSKTALGAEKSVPFEHSWQIWRKVDELKKQGYFIVALEQTPKSISYLKFKPKFPLALIIGNEVNGVSKSLLKRADKVIELPMAGVKESLNVSTAAAIALYHVRYSNY